MATISNQGGTVDALVDELARALDSKRIIKSYLPDSLSEEFAGIGLIPLCEKLSVSRSQRSLHMNMATKGTHHAEKMWIIEREYYESQERVNPYRWSLSGFSQAFR